MEKKVPCSWFYCAYTLVHPKMPQFECKGRFIFLYLIPSVGEEAKKGSKTSHSTFFMTFAIHTEKPDCLSDDMSVSETKRLVIIIGFGKIPLRNTLNHKTVRQLNIYKCKNFEIFFKMQQISAKHFNYRLFHSTYLHLCYRKECILNFSTYLQYMSLFFQTKSTID